MDKEINLGRYKFSAGSVYDVYVFGLTDIVLWVVVSKDKKEFQRFEFANLDDAYQNSNEFPNITWRGAEFLTFNERISLMNYINNNKFMEVSPNSYGTIVSSIYNEYLKAKKK